MDPSGLHQHCAVGKHSLETDVDCNIIVQPHLTDVLQSDPEPSPSPPRSIDFYVRADWKLLPATTCEPEERRTTHTIASEPKHLKESDQERKPPSASTAVGVLLEYEDASLIHPPTVEKEYRLDLLDSFGEINSLSLDLARTFFVFSSLVNAAQPTTSWDCHQDCFVFSLFSNQSCSLFALFSVLSPHPHPATQSPVFSISPTGSPLPPLSGVGTLRTYWEPLPPGLDEPVASSSAEVR